MVVEWKVVRTFGEIYHPIMLAINEKQNHNFAMSIFD